MELTDQVMFNGDELATNVWKSKYAQEGETHYDQMHKRLAKEFAKVELNYQITEPFKNSDLKTHKDRIEKLSKYGKIRKNLDEETIYNLFKDFKYIVPQGSIMSQLGAESIGSLSNCLGGDTKVLTRDGYIPIKLLKDKTVEIMTLGGGWVEAPFKSYGTQKLFKLGLTNGKSNIKEILCTEDHGWYVSKKDKSPKRTLLKELKVGDKLHSQFGKGRSGYKISSVGIAHGITYGDGHTVKGENNCNNITLCSDSRILGKYFPESYVSSDEELCEGGSDFYSGLPNYFRQLPSIRENKSYLLGFLSGWFAADGNIDVNGSMAIHSVNKSDILFIQDLCGVLGISCGEIQSQEVISNLTNKPHTMYKAFIHSNHLNEDFFLLEKHKSRFKVSDKSPGKWTVAYVTEHETNEEVYCAEVPNTYSFVIESNILSGNCFVIGTPEDSYGGIFQKDEQMAQLMKRRGGVGLDISTLRPKDTLVSNAAKTTTGAVSFMHRFSNTTNEVAQNGRRGALMLSIDINHPDVMDFIKIKRDKTSVTGANISIKINNDFMKAVENNEDYILRFPCNLQTPLLDENLEYNILTNYSDIGYVKRIKAKEYWEEIIKSAHGYAEPGIIFVDNHHNYSPDGAYPQFKGVTTNPCFHPDTLVETEYGRMKIKDINKPMRVYSMDSDGRLVMSNASASFISKKDAQTYKVTLRNGNSISLTEDHKLYIHNKGWTEVKNIKWGDKVGHLCRSRRGAKYAGVHLTTSPNKQRDQVMEHKLVYGPHEADYNIHHLDRNTYNNSIENLELLSHSEHSRITATEDNPQIHQVKGEKGRFISGEDSKKGKKIIVDLPEELKTNMNSNWHNTVVSIEEDVITDVYDIQVEDTHCLIANNMVAHNCGEIFMQPYDACRLIALNLYSFVKKPFTKDAEFDSDKFYRITYEAMRLSDDLIDLELKHIDRIIEKISKDATETSRTELELWLNIRSTAEASRRTGLGFTALGDCLAALGYKYDSEEALLFIEQMMHIKMEAELDCTIDLAILRGPFVGWDSNLEYHEVSNDFYKFIRKQFPEQYERMQEWGRRNVSISTVAPTGTVSLLTQTTSGIEPLFMPFYMRRKKVNGNERVDFVDEIGDKWQEFPVLHEKFKEWYLYNLEVQKERIEREEPERDITWTPIEELTKEQLQKSFEKSPWFGSTANDIDWVKRVELQSIVQKYTTHSISSTINLPNDVSEEEVSNIYFEAWKQGLKGITVYRDGSRDGVLISSETNKSRDEFNYVDAVKRPKQLDAEVHMTKVGGVPHYVIVGLLNNKPYEIFIENKELPIGKGILIKQSKGNYKFVKDGYEKIVTSEMSDEQAAITRLTSTSLRHGTDIKFLVEQLNKCDGDLFSFTKGLARTLKKYIPDGVKSTVSCQDCGSTNVIFEEGCNKCLDCGSSACS